MIKTIENEMAFIGALYKNPIKIVNYYRAIDAHEYFTEDMTTFFYERFKMFYDKFLKLAKVVSINEQQFKVFMLENKDADEKYKSFGGWSMVNRLMNIADDDKIDTYFKSLQKYALIRKLETKGFPVEKIISNKNFEKYNADDIVHLYNNGLNMIMASISKEQSTMDITQSMVEMVEGYCDIPYLGTPFKFKKYTDYFLGMNAGDIMLSFGYVNTGKSRKAVSMIADLVFKRNKRVGMFDNEMSAIKTRNCLITTICNDPDFGFELGVKERNIKLGQYKDLNEKNKVLEVAKFVESKKDMWYFKPVYDFSDEVLDMEIRKAVLGLDCEFIFYGTLKGYGKAQGEWATLKTTTNMIKNLSQELGVYTHLSAQLTMDSAKLDIFDLDETNIGESKGIAQIADFAVIDKEISKSLAEKCLIKTKDSSVPLDKNKRYNGSKIIKNRDGGKVVFVQEYDLDLNIWGQYDYISMEF
jgi:hypothetical protein